MAQRGRTFVGRAAELELLASALEAEEPSFAVLHVHGPGGVGKSALLRMYAQLGRQAGRVVVLVDGHDVQPNPAALEAALNVRGRRPGLLLLDSYELLAPLDDWLREEFLPGLPAGTLVVIGSRQPPAAGWQPDPAWRGLLRTVRLPNLTDREALAYLAAGGVPEDLRAAAVELARGLPLALTLVVDAVARGGRDAVAAAMNDPDLLRSLVSSLHEAAPDDLHRRALDVSALARVTDESLLRATLGIDDSERVFAWLRRLSCMESGPRGLYPHDLAREVLEADLRWRDEPRHRELSGRILGDVFRRAASERGRPQDEAIYDLFFTLRFDPVQRRYWDWETLGAAVAEPVRPHDRSSVLSVVAAHEGEESAALAAHWLDRQPAAFSVYRVRGETAGVICWLSLADAAPADIQTDPVTAAAWTHVQAQAPLAAGAEILLLRFHLDRVAAQRPSQTVNLVSLRHVQLVANHPALVWSFLVVTDPAFWAPHFEAIDFERVRGGDVAIGNRRFSIFAHDFRHPSPRWDGLRSTLPQPGPPLARSAFEVAVKQALRNCNRPDLLGRNPLAGLRWVDEAGAGGPALRAALVQAAETLRGHPRDEKLYRALDRTYFRPAPTQERAAELLDLPFSSYRRHLTQGVARVVDVLWEREHLSRN